MFLRSLGCIFLLTTASVAQKAPQYMLQINSNGLHISESTLGHAFMIVKVRTENGFKEDAFGFYSDPPARPQDLPRLVIGTRGALHHEFDRNPERFTKIEKSIEIPISYEQRKDIYTVVNKWNEHRYGLLDDNCMKFVDEVVEKVGIPTPDKASYVTPNQYVAALQHSYDTEQARLATREKERQTEEHHRTRAPEHWQTVEGETPGHYHNEWNVTFDGSAFSCAPSPAFSARCTATASGDAITVNRFWSSDNNPCSFTGTATGKVIKGTYGCSRYPGPYAWQATIVD